MTLYGYHIIVVLSLVFELLERPSQAAGILFAAMSSSLEFCWNEWMVALYIEVRFLQLWQGFKTELVTVSLTSKCGKRWMDPLMQDNNESRVIANSFRSSRQAFESLRPFFQVLVLCRDSNREPPDGAFLTLWVLKPGLPWHQGAGQNDQNGKEDALVPNSFLFY